MKGLSHLLFAAALSLVTAPVCLAQDDDAPKTLKACMRRLESLDYFQERWVANVQNPDGTTRSASKNDITKLNWNGTNIEFVNTLQFDDKPFKTITNRVDILAIDPEDITVKRIVSTPLQAGWSIASGLKADEFWQVMAMTRDEKAVAVQEIKDFTVNPPTTNPSQVKFFVALFLTEKAAHDFKALVKLAQSLASGTSAPAPPASGGGIPPAAPPAGPPGGAPSSLASCILQIKGLEWRHDEYTMTKTPNLTLLHKGTWSFQTTGSRMVVFASDVTSERAEGKAESKDAWTASLADFDPDDMSVEHQTLPDPQVGGWMISEGTAPSDIWVVALRIRGGRTSVEHKSTQLTGGQASPSTTEQVSKVNVPFLSEEAANHFRDLMRTAIGLGK